MTEVLIDAARRNSRPEAMQPTVAASATFRRPQEPSGLDRRRHAWPARHGLLRQALPRADGSEAKYVVFVPHDYTGDTALPAILYLHGPGAAAPTAKVRSSAAWRRPSERRTRTSRSS